VVTLPAGEYKLVFELVLYVFQPEYGFAIVHKSTQARSLEPRYLSAVIQRSLAFCAFLLYSAVTASLLASGVLHSIPATSCEPRAEDAQSLSLDALENVLPLALNDCCAFFNV